MAVRMRAVLLLVLVLGLVLAGCSGGDSSHDERSGGEGGTSAVEPSTTAGEPLQILVTNDDGVGAPGIDVLVNALREAPRRRGHRRGSGQESERELRRHDSPPDPRAGERLHRGSKPPP